RRTTSYAAPTPRRSTGNANSEVHVDPSHSKLPCPLPVITSRSRTVSYAIPNSAMPGEFVAMKLHVAPSHDHTSWANPVGPLCPIATPSTMTTWFAPAYTSP